MPQPEAEYFGSAREAAQPAPKEDAVIERLPVTTKAFTNAIDAEVKSVAYARQQHRLDSFRSSPMGSFQAVGAADTALLHKVREIGANMNADDIYRTAREIEAEYDAFVLDSGKFDDRLLDFQEKDALLAASKILLSVARESRKAA